jgi:hypothetical protein
VTGAGPGLWNIYFEYYNPTNGNKGIRIEVLCGNTVLVDQCLDAQPNISGNRYYKTYTNVPCANITTMLVRLTPFTGNSCGGSACGQVITSVGGGSLPVNFKSFTLARNHANVIVKWQTAMEQNNNGFTVERNINGSWQQVAFVASQAANGTSDAVLNYEYIDLNDAKGMTQYRIKQVDIDNKSTYSETRTIRGNGQVGKIIVFPNPTNNGKVNVSFEDASVMRDITLADMSGRVLKQWNSLVNTNNIIIEDLTPGIYTLRVAVPETGEQTVVKVVVNKR